MGKDRKIYIERVLNNGCGIGRIGGDDEKRQVVFVKGTIPGEIVSFKDELQKKNYIESSVDSIFVSSPSRRKPECEYFGKCGGCDFQHMDYSAQRGIKTDILQDLFAKNAGIEISADIGFYSSQEYSYRNKISLRGRDGKFGLVSENSTAVVPVEKCMIAQRTINQILKSINSLQIPDYAAGRIQIRVSSQGKSMVVLYSELESSAEYLPLFSLIEADNVIFLTKSGNAETVKGKGYLTDIIDGMLFKYSHSNFMQVNNQTASLMYGFLSEKISGGNRMIDLYSGVGVHAILFSRLFKEVYSIEGSRSSVHYQRLNLKENGIKNVRTIRSFIDDSFRIESDFRCTTLISDPPREGMSTLFLRNVLDIVEDEFIYISCNPATLARDAKTIVSAGFSLKEAAIFDMFPQTRHFETVAVFTR